MPSSNLRALLLRSLGAGTKNGFVGLATVVISAAKSWGLLPCEEAPRTFHKHFNSITGCITACKRVNIPDEMEVLLDEDEDIDLHDSESEGEQLDDPEWIGDGELATSRHVSSGTSSNAYNTDDDDMGEFDVEFDEAWEDEEEVDDLRDIEDSGSTSRHR